MRGMKHFIYFVTGCLDKHIGREGTHFDLSGLTDDAGEPEQLIHESLELIHCQFGTVTTALRTQTAAAETHGKKSNGLLHL